MAKEDQPTKDSKSKEPEHEQKVVHNNSAVRDNSSKYVLFGLTGIVVLAVVFWAGTMTQRPERLRTVMPFGPAGVHTFIEGGRRHFGGGFGFLDNQNGAVLSGKITSVNGNDFTLDQSGSSKTIKTDSNTRFMGVGIAGLKSGDQVTVAGTANSDGSIQAVSVSVSSSNSST